MLSLLEFTMPRHRIRHIIEITEMAIPVLSTKLKSVADVARKMPYNTDRIQRKRSKVKTTCRCVAFFASRSFISST